jgi:hypothetical protein
LCADQDQGASIERQDGQIAIEELHIAYEKFRLVMPGGRS